MLCDPAEYMMYMMISYVKGGNSVTCWMVGFSLPLFSLSLKERPFKQKVQGLSRLGQEGGVISS